MIVSDYSNRIIYTLRKKGVAALLLEICFFILNNIYTRGFYNIYEVKLPLKEVPCFDIGNAYIILIKTTEEFEKYNKDNFDFKGMFFRDRLKKGAIAFCIFINKQLVHVTWITFNEQAKDVVDPIPFKVDFYAKEVCSGASFTDPNQRGKGYLKTIYSYIFPYLSQQGIIKVVYSINKNNIPSLKALVHFNPALICQGHYKRFLWWASWEEKKISID